MTTPDEAFRFILKVLNPTRDQRELAAAALIYFDTTPKAAFIWNIVFAADPNIRPFQAQLAIKDFAVRGRIESNDAISVHLRDLIHDGFIIRQAVPGKANIWIINEFMLTPYIPSES